MAQLAYVLQGVERGTAPLGIADRVTEKIASRKLRVKGKPQPALTQSVRLSIVYSLY